MLRIDLDGRAMAMLVNFITPPGAFSFKIAFDEEYARFSPGVLVQIENLQLLGRGDIAWMDSCAAENHPMIDSLWGGRRSIVRVTRAARRLRGAARSSACAARPRAAWARLRGGARCERCFDTAALDDFRRHSIPRRRGCCATASSATPCSSWTRWCGWRSGCGPQDVEQNVGDLPIGIDPAAVAHNGLSVVETIRSIEQAARGWC